MKCSGTSLADTLDTPLRVANILDKTNLEEHDST